jgi:acetyl-CoA carboxylase carboxyl transferase subunit alpha
VRAGGSAPLATVVSLPAARAARPGAQRRDTPAPVRSAVPGRSETTCPVETTAGPERKHDLATQVAHLDFERAIADVEEQISALRTLARERGLDVSTEIVALERKLDGLKQDTFANLSPIERVQVARHPRRPYTMDYLEMVFTDFVELHGDRQFRDDEAIVGGWARLDGEPVMIIGHQKGRDMKENVLRNFGMPHPEGYRKALRLMKLAEKFRRPLICLIDTMGAYPGLGAEQRGQGEAIARNLREMAALRTPSVAVVIGEGGSGGALAIGVADRVLMLENSIYSVISPEGCAAILWKDAGQRDKAAQAMKITAGDLKGLGVIDEVIPEPPGGAHGNWEDTAAALKDALLRHIGELRQLGVEELRRSRWQKYMGMGEWRAAR